MSTLPVKPFDGQEFIDVHMVLWIFDAEFDCWKRSGAVSDIPLASLDQPGLLGPKSKAFIDTISPKGGGFGIIIDPKLTLRSEANPDGVLFGDIELVSSTLDIDCVFADGKKIPEDCRFIPFAPEVDDIPPGFDFNFSEKFLSTMCIELSSTPGAKGKKGEKGGTGAIGTGDGPQGDQGDTGIDVLTAVSFSGIKVEEIDDVFDTAIVNLELNPEEGKLFAIRAKVKTPDDDTPADKVIASPIHRSLEFENGSLVISEIMKSLGDATDTDPFIAAYPTSFNKESELNETEFTNLRLSQFLDEIVAFYQGEFDKISDEYDAQIEEFFKDTDAAAREKLDLLVMQLADCEFQKPIEFCVGISPSDCDADAGPGSGAISSICALSEFISGDPFCPESEGKDLGSIRLIPTGDPLNAKGREEQIRFQPTISDAAVPDLPKGLYVFLYTGGTFFDCEDASKGHFVEFEIEADDGADITVIPLPGSSVPVDPLDEGCVERARIDGPLMERLVAVHFTADGGRIKIKATTTSETVTGELRVRVLFCAECPPETTAGTT